MVFVSTLFHTMGPRLYPITSISNKYYSISHNLPESILSKGPLEEQDSTKSTYCSLTFALDYYLPCLGYIPRSSQSIISLFIIKRVIKHSSSLSTLCPVVLLYFEISGHVVGSISEACGSLLDESGSLDLSALCTSVFL